MTAGVSAPCANGVGLPGRASTPGIGVWWLGLEQDAAERLTAFDVGVGGRSAGEREGAVDDHAQRPDHDIVEPLGVDLVGLVADEQLSAEEARPVRLWAARILACLTVSAEDGAG